jgi:thiol-disulfide isomerase/thioredoxin
MDKVFVYMIDNYYKTGMAYWYEDAEKLKELIEAADKKANAMCGELAPNIILPDYMGKEWKSLYDIDKPYAVIVIWESSCGHCKKELPKLKTLYERWGEKLEVFAIGNDFENEEWIEFLVENDMTDWINVSDNPQINQSDSAYKLISMGITTLESLNFRKTFDISSTPKIFLMDKDKRVIAKQLNTPQLEELLGRLEEDFAAGLPPIEYPDDKVKKGKKKEAVGEHG